MVRLLLAIITWNTEETSLCNKEIILWEKVHYSTIDGSLSHSKFYYLLSQWKCPWLCQKGNWSSNFCDLNLPDYAIWDIMKKILYKNLKWYEHIEGLSAAMSYTWDRLTKKFINNSIDQWQIPLEKVLEEDCSHIAHLIWQHRLMIPLTFL